MDGVAFGVGRRPKACLVGRRYCCITGEWAADDLTAGVVIGSGTVTYKVALVREFISALLFLNSIVDNCALRAKFSMPTDSAPGTWIGAVVS
jgi:hypothetical protein